MRLAYLPLISLFFLAGCSHQPPMCSDENTLELVGQIFVDKLIELEGLSKKEIADNLKFEFPRASAFDKEIKKFTCEAKLVAGGTYQVPVQYESQLDDKNEHIVATFEMLQGDMLQIKLAIAESIKSKEKSGIGKQVESQEQSKNVNPIVSSQGISKTSIEKLLGGIYDKYMPSKKCWVATDNENKQKYCMKIDRNDKINAKGTNRLYVILTGTAIDEEGEENGAHVTSGLVGAFVIEENGSELKLIASDSKITMGTYGNAPENWELVKIGEDNYYGWKNESGDTHQGYSGAYFHILAPYGSKITDLGGFISSSYDPGACLEEPCNTTSFEAAIKFDSSKTSEKVFPIIVTVKGAEKGKDIIPKVYTFQFDEKKWQYLPPKDYILNDKEF